MIISQSAYHREVSRRGGLVSRAWCSSDGSLGCPLGTLARMLDPSLDLLPFLGEPPETVLPVLVRTVLGHDDPEAVEILYRAHAVWDSLNPDGRIEEPVSGSHAAVARRALEWLRYAFPAVDWGP